VIANWAAVSFAEIRITMPILAHIEDKGKEHP
jgi:hypothetical protein